ncbi:MAG: PPC domain-containing protein [Pirellulaceae bacterium]|nr:PPC domain-containing protein [Pirellulaceae bacterium]
MSNFFTDRAWSFAGQSWAAACREHCRTLVGAFVGAWQTSTLIAITCGLGVAWLPNWAQADQPVIRRMTPTGFQRGQDVEVVLTGQRLSDATKILFYQPGIEQIDLQVDSENKVTVKLRIADDCPPGIYSFRLASRTGTSNIRYFGIGALPIVDEVEPNSDFAAPQSIAVNSTVHGLCTSEDVDYYAVQLEAGQKLTVELEGLRLGTDFFDPFVAILDEDRFELARSDDAPLVQQDCICSFVATEAGKYIVQVRESSFGGNDRAFYRLHVGDFPRPLSITPAGGRPGELIQATVVDASGQSWNEPIQLPTALGDFAYTASRDGKLAPSPNGLRVVDIPCFMETLNDEVDRSGLAAVDLPAAFHGVLEQPGDTDWFKVRGKKDQTVELNVYGRRVLRSPVDSWLEVYNAAGGLLAANDDNGGKPDSFLSFKFPEDGEYLIAIRDQLRAGGPSYSYRIEALPPSPSLHFTVDELVRYTAPTMDVPQGGRMALLLRANRANFRGALDLRLEGAPAGIQLETAHVTADQGFIPMMVRASADATPDAALVNLVGQTTADAPSLTGQFVQRTTLVFGQNRVDVWGHDAQRLTVNLTEPLPFTISLDQPHVPLTRMGESEYVVRVQRQEGYAEPIDLRLLYNPSGVSASGSVRIEGDQSETRIPVTANPQAALGTFPITVLAQAKVRNAQVWCATEFIQLEIQDSYFDFKFPKAVVAQGESGFVTINVESKQPPEGEVELELVGLPAGVVTGQPKMAWAAGAEQVNFPVTVDADARVGKHQTLAIKCRITRPTGLIQQTQGTGELQIVSPPPKPVEMAATPAPAPEAPSAPAAPPTKVLSRLEQLRQAAAAAAAAGGS